MTPPVHPIARSRAQHRHLAVLIVPLALGLTTMGAPRESPPVPPSRTPAGIAGQLLVALEDLPDPRFFHTVIYMVQHDRGGALGLVINRPLGDAPLADLLAELGLDGHGTHAKIRVHYGGPVEPGRGFVIHTTDYMTAATQRIAGDIAVTGAPAILEAVARGKGPRRSLFALGYAGWAPGQLEAEIDRNAWIVIPSDPDLIFGNDYEHKWERALARRKTDV